MKSSLKGLPYKETRHLLQNDYMANQDIHLALLQRDQKCIVFTIYTLYLQTCETDYLSFHSYYNSHLQTSETSDIYTVYTRMPFSLPFVDVVGTKPGQDGVEIQLGEVCFA